ncbi:hypothetical protein HQ865_07745 [Mucilaginibacter mali]|uniref:Uncharacterized protein n=1 Tax=Mucilaginibacter mali TaxID=2740462 RepID=A0A7D4QJA1_9SPHI|nr:hypothetical protein [Mucilaginibacter mali]QKJ29650.1 hypothetical protein HQ865_07745 [Mucilaginibacter mali]
METLPGWKIDINEIANNVYRVTLTDAYGRQAGATGTDLGEVIKQVEGYAIDIEKQIREK